MTRKKTNFARAALAAATILAAAFQAGCGPDTGVFGTVDRTFTVTGPVRLELQNGSGDSRVVVGSPGEVRIHAEFRIHGWPWDDPDRTLKGLIANPPFSQDANLIRIGRYGWEMNEVSADYLVTVPPDTQMRGGSGSGNVDVNGIAGPASITAGSGNITATAVAGETHAFAGSGNVTLTDTLGRIDATTGSGNIVVHGGKDEIRLRAGSGNIHVDQPGANVTADTGSGNVDVRSATADVRVRTGSGEISLDGNPAPSSYWDVRASSGDVRLHVAPDASFWFYARSSSGDINVGVPSAADESRGKRDYQARIGDGKARVEIGTSSGDISLH
jgi:Putative adhesin